MSQKSPLHKRRQALMKAYVLPLLKPLAFKGSGPNIIRSVGDVVQVFHVQQSPSNRLDRIEFTFNCGVCVRGVWLAYTGFQEPDSPQLHNCTLAARIGLLTPETRDAWWEMTPTDPPEHDQNIGEAMRRTVEFAIANFLGRFEDARSVAAFCSQPREPQDRFIHPRCESTCYVYGGIIWNMLGECEKCRAAMAQAIVEAGTKRLEAPNVDFAKNFVCDGKPKVGKPHK